MTTEAWQNWRAFDSHEPELENVLDEAYSDQRFVGGPTQVGPTALHAVLRNGGTMGPAVMMLTGIHANLTPELIVDSGLARADSSAYHGGSLSDEIAALVSLELGVRLRVAGTRQLSGTHEHKPSSPLHLEVSPLVRPGRNDREVLPRVIQRNPNLDQLELLGSFPSLEGAAAIALVRAAREYTSGIWWANEDSDQGWLHLISAVEVAAAQRQKDSAEATDLLQTHWPEAWAALTPADSSVRAAMAEVLAPQMRASRRFVDFIEDLAPDPPEPRPPWDELDWSDMRRHARTIYTHRSNALHAGKPFPLPMRKAPREDSTGALQEAPWGLSSGGAGAIWMKKETPMLLSTFEYIVRGALLSWWGELAETSTLR
ncbi:hypothetical protein [Serinibacter arcticus]|uniref:hypothetical protein n=1 Tax=Serinibacter arcticus TaxID=1655435 RepID=UPI001092B5E3|nr:hypothetical protein [Serinibacter arcticus]